MRTVSLMVGLLFLATTATAAVTVVRDGDFADADWELVSFSFKSTSGAHPGGSVTASQQSGGNPGTLRRVVNNIAQAPSGSEFSSSWGVHLKKGFVYDPSVQGAIATIDYSEDARKITSQQLTGFAVRQGGKLFYTEAGVFNNSSWTRVEQLAIDPSIFTEVTADGLLSGSKPDFSASGGSLEIGFIRANSNGNGGGAYSVTGDIDNWEVRIAPPCTTAIDCDDGELCTTDACVVGKCTVTAVQDCSDGDGCTADTCIAGVCGHVPLVCDDGDGCTVDACVAGTCQVAAIDRDDARTCTLDRCAGGACTHTPSANEATVEAKISELLAIVKSRACAGDTLVKSLGRKVSKKLKKARAIVANADDATKAGLIRKLLDRADTLIAAARKAHEQAIARGQVSPGCGAALGNFLDEIAQCADGVPRP
jgi:hypothetical protein